MKLYDLLHEQPVRLNVQSIPMNQLNDLEQNKKLTKYLLHNDDGYATLLDKSSYKIYHRGNYLKGIIFATDITGTQIIQYIEYNNNNTEYGAIATMNYIWKNKKINIKRFIRYFINDFVFKKFSGIMTDSGQSIDGENLWINLINNYIKTNDILVYNNTKRETLYKTDKNKNSKEQLNDMIKLSYGDAGFYDLRIIILGHKSMPNF